MLCTSAIGTASKYKKQRPSVKRGPLLLMDPENTAAASRAGRFTTAAPQLAAGLPPDCDRLEKSFGLMPYSALKAR